MATLTAYRSFDSDEIYTFEEDVLSATPSKISLVDSIGIEATNFANVRVDYGGTFKYSAGYLSSGTLKSATVFFDSIKYYSVTGSYDAVTYARYASGDTDDFLAFVFSGDDKFNGSEQNDWFSFIDGSGNDKFYGKGGNDLIATNVGYKSTVDGGGGDDYIQLWGDNDSVKGGKGADIFNIRNFGAPDKDVISDFNINQGDSITIGLYGFTYDDSDYFYFNSDTEVFEPYSSQCSVVQGKSTSQDYDNYFIYDSKSGNLYHDIDATGSEYSSELVVNFSNKPKFSIYDLSEGVIKVYDAENVVDPFATTFITDNYFGWG